MAGKLVGKNKNAPERRMNTRLLAETESTHAHGEPWMGWRGVDLCWALGLVVISRKPAVSTLNRWSNISQALP
jgi:hypothetical protein